MGRCSGSKGTSAAMLQPTLAAVTASSGCKAITDVIVNGHQVNALIDSGSSLSCIDPSLVHKLELSVHPESKKSNNKSFHTAGCYPLPNINDIVQKIAQYSVFSTIDLRRAYHQIPLKEEDKPYNTAFEASCGLYQFNRMPFGVTNGVAGFQRSIDGVITKENIKDTFAYVDNVTLCAKTQKEHDENLEKFLEAAKNYNMTFNEEKSTFSTDRFTLFGSVITKGTIKPDLERLRPLKELPPPQNITAQRHVIGMFSYYSKWIPKFSEKIRLLIQNKQFPMSGSALQTFKQLKLDIENSIIYAIDDSIPFEVETNASDYAIAATLNQPGKPVTFFSRTLYPSEQNHSPVEKEAYAIVESLKCWRHFLLGRHFKLITDQRLITFMYNNKCASKNKNEKLMRCRVELSCFKYDIVYHPGRDNKGPDTFNRMFCASVNDSSLHELHNSLCHPGVTRCHNLPYSVEEIKRMTSTCSVFAELKPRFHRSTGTLVKATQSFERLNIDFKGPLPTSIKNKYMLTTVDEFSCFPFVSPCQDINSSTVIKCLCQLFAIFGMPSYVHSDRGSSLISEELKKSSNKGEYCFTETPCGQPALNQSNNPGSDNSIEHRTPAPEPAEVPVSSGETVGERIPTQELRDECVTERLHEPEQILRRSECIRRPPDKLNL
eukprot:gene14587-16090_t